MVIAITSESDTRPLLYALLKCLEPFGSICVLTDNKYVSRVINGEEDSEFRNIRIVIDSFGATDDALQRNNINPEDYDYLILDNMGILEYDKLIIMLGAHNSLLFLEECERIIESNKKNTIPIQFGKIPALPKGANTPLEIPKLMEQLEEERAKDPELYKQEEQPDDPEPAEPDDDDDDSEPEPDFDIELWYTLGNRGTWILRKGQKPPKDVAKYVKDLNVRLAKKAREKSKSKSASKSKSKPKASTSKSRPAAKSNSKAPKDLLCAEYPSWQDVESLEATHKFPTLSQKTALSIYKILGEHLCVTEREFMKGVKQPDESSSNVEYSVW